MRLEPCVPPDEARFGDRPRGGAAARWCGRRRRSSRSAAASRCAETRRTAASASRRSRSRPRARTASSPTARATVAARRAGGRARAPPCRRRASPRGRAAPSSARGARARASSTRPRDSAPRTWSRPPRRGPEDASRPPPRAGPAGRRTALRLSRSPRSSSTASRTVSMGRRSELHHARVRLGARVRHERATGARRGRRRPGWPGTSRADRAAAPLPRCRRSTAVRRPRGSKWPTQPCAALTGTRGVNA